MKKVVMMKGQDAVIDQFTNDMKALTKASIEKLRFIEKQAKNLMKEADAKKSQLWIDIEEHLRKQEKMPSDYSDDQHFLEWDDENGILWALDKSSQKTPDFAKFLSKLLS